MHLIISYHHDRRNAMLAGLFDDLPNRDGAHEHKPLDGFIKHI